MKEYLDITDELTGLGEAKELLQKGPAAVEVHGCTDSQKSHIQAILGNGFKLNLIVTDDEKKTASIEGDCRFFGARTCIYPAKDMIFYSADIHGNQISRDRLRCIKEISDVITGLSREPLTVITTVGALMEKLTPLSRFTDRSFTVKKGDEFPMDDIISGLVETGYERKALTEEPGDFSERGGIIDIFPTGADDPVRIEMWGDDIDSIRCFDPDSQRSREELESVMIFPATESLFSEEETDKGFKKINRDFEARLKELEEDRESGNRLRKTLHDLETGGRDKGFLYFEKDTANLTDYFPEDISLISFYETKMLKAKAGEIKDEYDHSAEFRYAKGYILPGQKEMLESPEKIFKKAKAKRFAGINNFGITDRAVKADISINAGAKGINAYNNSFAELVSDIKRFKKEGYRTVAVTGSLSRRNRMAEELEAEGISCFFGDEVTGKTPAGSVMVVAGSISHGFIYPEVKFALITENDIFTAGGRKKKREKTGKRRTEELALTPGDFVVHERYGIGIYRGIEKKTIEGIEKDYIKIEYAGKSALFIVATQTDVLQRYACADTDKPPKVNKLGSPSWSNAKTKAREGAERTARDLVRLYAARMSAKGFAFSPDTPWQTEFEESFPYEETTDQLDAIRDVKRDMESSRIMERLICGDVGFGKTEVALRAAFKAVQDGKQVAFLTPTTILAGQHFDTFTERLRTFPVTVGLMSGLQSTGENRKCAASLAKGLTDIVIGTHRILSKDVSFKDLGLLIIDEEQRFGVNHKEKIKKLKENVDVLALSATPIPRTLNMSLAGIRDMSTLEEPPSDRMPVQTFVSEKEDSIIREAITREIKRGGQVYFVSNRINNIEEVRAGLEELVPDAAFAILHGRMDKKDMERIMIEFINGETDVLISTTIIETGLDIPNVNTIIIDNADRFGLSQLYQLRGRVGRSTRRAYAFLLYTRDKVITEVANKRLSAIRDLTELGSGYRLAMKDLEIRGAGNLLGKTQHGHMEAVGFDMYTRMLNEEVSKLKGIPLPEVFETEIDLNTDAFLPDSYINRESQKLEFYKRISAVTSREDMDEIADELRDRFGEIPESAVNLLNIALVKAYAHDGDITEVKSSSCAGKNVIKLVFKEIADQGKLQRARKLAEENRNEFIYSDTGKEKILLWNGGENQLERLAELLKNLEMPE